MDASLKQKKLAKDVFKSLCDMLDDNGFKYEKDKGKLCLNCVMQGEDIPVTLSVIVSAELSVVLTVSQMPFIVPKERRDAMAVAVCEANCYINDGCFEFNYLTGEVNFRLTTSFANSIVGKELMRYIVYVTCQTTDAYNDKFLFVSKNDMSADEVVKYLH